MLLKERYDVFYSFIVHKHSWFCPCYDPVICNLNVKSFVLFFRTKKLLLTKSRHQGNRDVQPKDTQQSLSNVWIIRYHTTYLINTCTFVYIMFHYLLHLFKLTSQIYVLEHRKKVYRLIQTNTFPLKNSFGILAPHCIVQRSIIKVDKRIKIW